MPLYVDAGEGTGRAEVLAGTAADASSLVDGWNHGLGLVTIEGHHLNGTGRTVACTVTAVHTVRHADTVLPHPYGMADLYGGLVCQGDGFDGTSGADAGAAVALRAAEASLVAHGGLHEGLQVGAGMQHVVGALAYAKLTGCTVLLQVLRRD